MNEQKPSDKLEQLLAVCLVPQGVEARAEALDRCVILLEDVRSAVLGVLGGDLHARAAVSLIAQAARSLIAGARTMLPDNYYAASALVRQLVEVEYLAWACGQDEAEILDWITSNSDARRKRWQPRHLRDRAGDRFDPEDYKAHCEMGGHPTPAGILTLNGPTFAQPELIAMDEVQSYELALHAVAACDYLTQAIPDAVTGAKELRDRSHSISRDWRASDPASLLTVSDPNAQQKAALVTAFAEGMVKLAERAADWRGLDLSRDIDLH